MRSAPTAAGPRAMIVILAAAGISVTTLPLAAQEPPPVTPVTAPPVAADTLGLTLSPSPRGAAFRSMALPGWGQLYVGAPRRAAVFITLQTTSWAMLGKSVHRLGQSRDVERGRARDVRDSILVAAQTDTALARLVEDPFELDDMIGNDPGVASARGLVRARTRHQQDWITYTLVLTMASAIDAYVAAHLTDFPAAITAEPRGDGGVSVQLSVPVGRSRQ